MGKKANVPVGETTIVNEFDIIEVFNAVQKYPARIKHFANQLYYLYKLDSKTFPDKFFPCLNIFLFTPHKDFIKTILDFLTSFFLLFERSEDDDLHPFQEEIMMHILKDEVMYSKTQSVRLRACQLIRKILCDLPGDISLSEELCEAIIKPLTILLKDTKSTIRTQAIASLYRLQDPTDPNDIVTKLYTYHLCKDPDARVRRCCIQFLARSFDLLPFVFGRISDVDERVRKDSFLYLSKFNFKTFKIQQRLILLDYGLQDESLHVQHCVREEVIPKWIEKFGSPVFQFLETLRLDVDKEKLEHSIKISKMLLKLLFTKKTPDECRQMLPLNDSKTINLEDLTHEKMLCWSTLVEHFYEIHTVENNILDDFLPEVKSLCRYIDAYLIADNLQIKENELINQSILLQLFEILLFCDFAEIAGFDFTKDFITRLLISHKLSMEVIELLMDILSKLFPDFSERTALVAGIVSELMNPDDDEDNLEPSSRSCLMKDVKLAELKLQMFNLKEEEAMAVESADYLKAAEVKTKINDLNKLINQEQTAVVPVEKETKVCLVGEDAEYQVLGIYAALLQTIRMKSMPANIETFIEEVVLVTLRDIKKDVAIQKSALTCLVRFALQNEKYATIAVRTTLLKLAALKHFPEIFDVDLVKISMSSIADLLTLYGSSHFSENENETISKTKRTLYQNDDEIEKTADESFNPAETIDSFDTLAVNENITSKLLVNKLVSYLDDADSTIRTIAGESICRLLTRGVLHSPNIISRLNIYMFNPATSKDEKLRQIISTTLSYCATLADFQKNFEEAFFLTLKTYFEAPPSSPLAEIDSKILLSHLIYHTSPTLKPSNDYNPHNNIAKKMCEKILAEPDGLIAYYYAKEIITLNINTDDADLVETLSKMAKQIIDKTSSKVTNSGMQKFLDILSQYPKTTQNTVLTERNSNTNDELNTSKLYLPAYVILDKCEEKINGTNSSSSSPITFKASRVEANNVVLSSSSSSASEFEDNDSDDSCQPIKKRTKLS